MKDMKRLFYSCKHICHKKGMLASHKGIHSPQSPDTVTRALRL